MVSQHLGAGRERRREEKGGSLRADVTVNFSDVATCTSSAEFPLWREIDEGSILLPNLDSVGLLNQSSWIMTHQSLVSGLF